MKFNFKFLLAAVIVPASYITFSSVSTIDSSYPAQASPKPYIVEVISATGESAGQFRGLSVQTDPFSIAIELGAAPYVEDKFLAFPDIKMSIGSQITIYRAPSYKIIDGKKEFEYRSWTKTVGELLVEKKIEIGEDDKINFSKDTVLELNMEIRIIRVAITSVKKSESIDFRIIKKDDNTLDQGKIRIEQIGVLGEKVLTYEVRREDGVEVSRKLTNTEITKEPVTEIRIIGTKPVITGWCRYNDMVLDASIRNGLDPNKLCVLMRKESNGHPNSVNPRGPYVGLFQYSESFWQLASSKAGYSGADIYDAKAQIYVTAWALTHGYAGRW